MPKKSVPEDRRARMERHNEELKRHYRDLDWLRSRINSETDPWIQAQIVRLKGFLRASGKERS